MTSIDYNMFSIIRKSDKEQYPKKKFHMRYGMFRISYETRDFP